MCLSSLRLAGIEALAKHYVKYGKLPSEYNKPLVRKTVVGIGAEARKKSSIISRRVASRRVYVFSEPPALYSYSH